MNEYIPITDFTYNLPEDRIAKYPLVERDASKLLVYNAGKINEDKFINLHHYINPQDILIFNDTKVIRARLVFQKETGAKIEIFCLEPLISSDYYQSFQKTKSCTWKCLVGNLKKWKKGKAFISTTINSQEITIEAENIAEGNDWHEIRFSWNTDHSFGEILEHVGNIPIPPYLRRETEAVDSIRYQTIYSNIDGSVAAPTAGLHFTEKVFDNLKKSGATCNYVTLHVGAGTFRPVKDENVTFHHMHAEHFFIKKELLEKLISSEGTIVSIGTTSLRALESLYWIGVKLIENEQNAMIIEQWEPYHLPQHSLIKSFEAILEYCRKNNLQFFEATTQIMIVPGYKFKVVKKLITNFHQPKSTLLLLIAAFLENDNWKMVYNYALENNFRFLSYGDSSLLIP